MNDQLEKIECDLEVAEFDAAKSYHAGGMGSTWKRARMRIG